MSCIPLPLHSDKLTDAVIQAKDWALTHGIVLRTKENPDKSELISYAPFTLLPTPVPRNEYEHVVKIQRHINLLMHHVANDEQFLTDVLKSTIDVDEFTAKLFSIYKIVQKEGITQPLQLGLLRSDYMIDETNQQQPSSIKQIEINTIASSFAGLGHQVALFHKYILQYLGYGSNQMKGELPDNTALAGLANGLLSAYKAYKNSSAVILFLVEPEACRNIFDQRWVEFAIRDLDPCAKVIRRSLREMRDGATICSNTRSLHIDGYEVAVVYFRDGYVPQSYESEQDWTCRLLMERSRAIKCPNIAYHLAGTKKVQQELSRPHVLERFIDDKVACENIRKTFAGQYALDLDSEGDAAASLAIANPHKYVLKPQLEGGGHNVFGDDIRDVLRSMHGAKDRASYILMDKITAKENDNYIIRHGEEIAYDGQPHQTLSELGIYGVILVDSSNGHILCNNQCGHLVRTKKVSSDEGGVAAGFGSVDSPFLC